MLERIKSFLSRVSFKLKIFFSFLFPQEKGAPGLGKVRAIVMGTSLLNVTRKEISFIGAVGKRFMYEAGKETGKEFTRLSTNFQEFDSVSELLKFGEMAGTVLGWGKMKAVDTDLTDGEARLELWNTFLTSDKEEKTCEYLAGVFAGAAEEFLGEPIDAKEIQCKNEGNDKCVFVAKKSEGIGMTFT